MIVAHLSLHDSDLVILKIRNFFGRKLIFLGPDPQLPVLIVTPGIYTAIR